MSAYPAWLPIRLSPSQACATLTGQGGEEPAPEPAAQDPVENQTFVWSTKKLVLPERYKTILADNPLADRNARRKLAGLLPAVVGLEPAPPPPSLAGLRVGPLDATLQGWGNRLVEVQKTTLLAHWILNDDHQKLDLPEIRMVDLLEEQFTLVQALAKHVEATRKGLLDKRLKPAATEEAQGSNCLITADDLKVIDKQEKFKKTFQPFKPKGGKGWKPYSRPSFKGKAWGHGKGYKGKGGGRGPPRFSFSQTVPKQHVVKAD